MKTVLVSTCWLDNADYMNKTKKWLNYYTDTIYGSIKYDEIILLDNASKFENIRNLIDFYPDVLIQRFTKHLPRGGHLDYPYAWRAVDFFIDLFNEYDKIIYMENDFYVLSNKMCSWINNINSGWHSAWCNKHNFPETALQVIVKDSEDYRAGHPWSRLNGTTMELELPLQVNKELKGDRHSEYLNTIPDNVDFSAQVILDMNVKFKQA